MLIRIILAVVVIAAVWIFVEYLNIKAKKRNGISPKYPTVTPHIKHDEPDLTPKRDDEN